MPSCVKNEASSFLLAVADFSHLVLEFAFIFFFNVEHLRELKVMKLC